MDRISIDVLIHFVALNTFTNVEINTHRKLNNRPTAKWYRYQSITYAMAFYTVKPYSVNRIPGREGTHLSGILHVSGTWRHACSGRSAHVTNSSSGLGGSESLMTY